MRADARGVAATLALGAAVASICYTVFALTRLRAFERRIRERPRAQRHPHVTVLKPLHGDEPGLAENLRSFCAQDYPSFDVIFTVRDTGDGALPAARRVAAEFPERVRVVIGDVATATAFGDSDAGGAASPAMHANPKIANLAPAFPLAGGEILAIADSDMRVGPDWLDAVVAAFDDEAVGAATCLYRGEPATGAVADALGAMWITEQFAPSALVACALEPLRYCFGATMAVRRDIFEAIGGAAALGAHVADDHLLGRLVAERGRTVALVPYVVTNIVYERNLRALVLHETRWARTIRSVRPASYFGIALTYPVPLAVTAALLSRDRLAPLMVVAAAASRLLIQRYSSHVLGGTVCRPLLTPFRDTLGTMVWFLGCTGGTVHWNDTRITMGPNGAVWS